MRYCLLLIGVFFCSTSVLFLKESTWPPIMLSAARLLAAAILLAPVYGYFYKRQQPKLSHRQLFKNSAIPALMLSVHFMSWIMGLRMTSIANATLIVNTVPLCMPFVVYLLLREKPTRYEIICTSVAMLGLLLIAAGDFHLSTDSFYGDLICFASMTGFALYLGLARVYKQASHIWLYVTPVYTLAGSFCLVLSFFIDDWTQVSYAAREWLYIAALAILPTILGHSILNAAMRWFRGQVVSIVNMMQFMFAGVMAWFLYLEIPTLNFFCASILIVGAAVALMYFYRQETLEKSRHITQNNNATHSTES